MWGTASMLGNRPDDILVIPFFILCKKLKKVNYYSCVGPIEWLKLNFASCVVPFVKPPVVSLLSLVDYGKGM